MENPQFKPEDFTNYVIVSRIGEGSLSTTYRAENVQLPINSPLRCIAIKRFKPEFLAHGEQEALIMRILQGHESSHSKYQKQNGINSSISSSGISSNSNSNSASGSGSSSNLNRTPGRDKKKSSFNNEKDDGHQNNNNTNDDNDDDFDTTPKHYVKFHAGFLLDSEYIIILELLDWTRPLTLIPPPAYYTPSLGTLYEQNPYNNLAKLAVQLLSALVEINKKGFAHCDIKPENILYSDSHVGNRVKLIDFGNATPLTDLKSFHDDFQIQSPGYRAPEVLVGDYEMNEKIDVWSVGVILVELLVNHVFRSFRHSWRLVAADSRLSSVICIARSIDSFDSYQTRKTKFWSPEFSASALKNNGQISEISSMVNSLVRVLSTRQELLALDFVLSLIQIDHRKRWSAKKALLHPFLIKSLQPVWAQALLDSKSKVPGDSFVLGFLG